MFNRGNMRRGRIGRLGALALAGGLGVGLISPAAAASGPLGAAPTAIAVSAAKSVQITSQPKSATVAVNKYATFKVKASGTSVSYRWQVLKPGKKKWVDLKGAKKSTYRVKAKKAQDGAKYRVVVRSGKKKFASRGATLRVVTTPKITRQPKAGSTGPRTNATFSVGASGRGLNYTWQSRSPGGAWKTAGTGSKLTVRATTALHGTDYRVVVKNIAGKVVSTHARLSVPTRPSISSQPRSVRVHAGSVVAFDVVATGSDPRYQWQSRPDDESPWRDVSGATSSTLRFTARTAQSSTEYRVVVSNALGSVTSSHASLFVQSTAQDPAAPKTAVILDSWGVISTSATRDGTAEVIAENMYSDVPTPGWQYALVDVVACYFGPDSSLTWLDLGVEFLGADGRTYSPGGNILPNDIMDAGTVYTDGCTTFTAGALVPSSVVSGGSWVFTDSSGYPYVTGFVSAS